MREKIINIQTRISETNKKYLMKFASYKFDTKDLWNYSSALRVSGKVIVWNIISPT